MMRICLPTVLVFISVCNCALSQQPNLYLLPAPSDDVVADEPDGEEIVADPAEPDEVIFEDPPEWYTPVYWFSPKIWELSLELGLNGTEGNAESLSYKTGADLKRELGQSKLEIDFRYARTKADSIETQHFALMNAEHNWNFGESRWSTFVKTQVSYDEFKAFDTRLQLNAGFGYDFIKNDAVNLKGKFGAGASREFGGPDDDWKPEAVFGLNYEHQLTEKQKLKAKIEYLPEWADFTNYRINTDIGWEVVLDADAHLSLKIGIIDQYDSTPNGAKPNDLNYSLLLLWKS